MRWFRRKEKTHLRRIAAYCNINNDDSYSALCEHYVGLISENQDMVLVGMYRDEKTPGRNIDNRPSLNKLIQDCKDGRVDVVMISTVSQLSRNIVECYKVIKELRKHDVRVIFEKEQIDSEVPWAGFDSKPIYELLGI